MEQKPEMGYCPFEYWLGWAQGARHGTSTGAGALALGRAGCAGVQGARVWQERGGARAAGRLGRAGRATGRAAGPASCALGARSLFLARFDSVFFRSQIFGHCSCTQFMNTVHHKIF